MKLFRTDSPGVVKCCQLAFNFLPVRSQLDIRTANCLQQLIASENGLCYLFSLTARRKLDELCLPSLIMLQLLVSFLISLHSYLYTCFELRGSCEYHLTSFMFSSVFAVFLRNNVENINGNKQKREIIILYMSSSRRELFLFARLFFGRAR